MSQSEDWRDESRKQFEDWRDGLLSQSEPQLGDWRIMQMRSVIDYVKAAEEVADKKDEIYQEYLEFGPYTVSELAQIRGEIDIQVSNYREMVHGWIDHIIPFEIYFKSEFFQNENSSFIAELKAHFDEEKDLFRAGEYFTDNSIRVIQSRFYNKLSTEQVREARGVLADMVVFSKTIHDFNIRKDALNRFIRHVLREPKIRLGTDSSFALKEKNEEQAKRRIERVIGESTIKADELLRDHIEKRMKELVKEGYSDHTAAKTVHKEIKGAKGISTIKRYYKPEYNY